MRCCAPSWRSRSIPRRAWSAAATMRARDARNSARVSALAIAVATRSAKSPIRASVSPGIGSFTRRTDDQRAPRVAVDGDRRAHPGMQTDVAQPGGDRAVDELVVVDPGGRARCRGFVRSGCRRPAEVVPPLRISPRPGSSWVASTRPRSSASNSISVTCSHASPRASSVTATGYRSAGFSAACHQGGDAAQRGLLLGECVGLAAAFLRLGGPQPGLAGEHAGQQCQWKEHEERGDQVVAVLDVEVDVDRRAGQRRGQRQAEVPPGRDDQHAEQEDRPVRVVRCGSLQQQHQKRLADDEADRDHDAPAKTAARSGRNTTASRRRRIRRQRPSASPSVSLELSLHRMLMRAPTAEDSR